MYVCTMFWVDLYDCDMRCNCKAFLVSIESMMDEEVKLSIANNLKTILFSSAGCERTAPAPLHRLSDGLPLPSQLLVRDVSEEPGGAHWDQKQHEETQLHDQAEPGQLGWRRRGVLRLTPQDCRQLCADRWWRWGGEVEMCVCWWVEWVDRYRVACV